MFIYPYPITLCNALFNRLSVSIVLSVYSQHCFFLFSITAHIFLTNYLDSKTGQNHHPIPIEKENIYKRNRHKTEKRKYTLQIKCTLIIHKNIEM